MNVKLPAILSVVAASVRLLAAEPAASPFLLKANSMIADGQRVVATDQATLVTQRGDTRLTADKIVYDPSAATFTLTGHVKIQSGGTTIETSDATINASGQRIVQLTSGQITFSSFSSGVPVDADAAASKVPDFSKPLPKTETKLPVTR